MPRLRKFKNYNFKDFTDENEDVDQVGQRYFSTLGEDGATGSHWLNNSFIISSLNEAHISQAIKYHQTQIALLQAELSARKAGLRSQNAQISGDTSFDPSEFTFIPAQRYSGKTRRQRQDSKQNLVLNTDQKLVAKVVKMMKKLGISREDLEGIL